ncbi:MAG: serine acetyltransferase [Flavobacteriaceae bacterium]
MIFTYIANKIGGYWALRTKQEKSSALGRKFYALIHKGFQYETNSYLPFETTIKGSPNFLHGVFGIFISGGVSIGKNCTIYQQVTIGSNMLIDSKGFGYPTIGDNCLIGAGAKIIGNVIIGDNCRIGANAVVTKNMPDNSVCVIGKSLILSDAILVNRIYQKRKNNWGFMENGLFVKERDLDVLRKLSGE